MTTIAVVDSPRLVIFFARLHYLRKCSPAGTPLQGAARSFRLICPRRAASDLVQVVIVGDDLAFDAGQQHQLQSTEAGELGEFAIVDLQVDIRIPRSRLRSALPRGLRPRPSPLSAMFCSSEGEPA